MSDNSKPSHGHKWMPAMYVTYYGILKDIAMAHGYALCVHGSVVRDFDLVAVPWVENPSSHDELLQAFAEKIGIRVNDSEVTDKPGGRKAYSLHLGGGGSMDISITPMIKK